MKRNNNVFYFALALIFAISAAKGIGNSLALGITYGLCSGYSLYRGLNFRKLALVNILMVLIVLGLWVFDPQRWVTALIWGLVNLTELGIRVPILRDMIK